MISCFLLHHCWLKYRYVHCCKLHYKTGIKITLDNLKTTCDVRMTHSFLKKTQEHKVHLIITAISKITAIFKKKYLIISYKRKWQNLNQQPILPVLQYPIVQNLKRKSLVHTFFLSQVCPYKNYVWEII